MTKKGTVVWGVYPVKKGTLRGEKGTLRVKTPTLMTPFPKRGHLRKGDIHDEKRGHVRGAFSVPPMIIYLTPLRK
jgi:hypothetical protein